jgi:hypothetical protein
MNSRGTPSARTLTKLPSFRTSDIASIAISCRLRIARRGGWWKSEPMVQALFALHKTLSSLPNRLKLTKLQCFAKVSVGDLKMSTDNFSVGKQLCSW